MAFTMRGRVRASDGSVEVVWDDGRLSGDVRAIHDFEFEAAILEGHRLGPPEGPVTTSNHLQSGISVQEVALRVFLGGEYDASGDVPHREDREGLR